MELILQRQNENLTSKANSKNHPLSLSIITIALLMNFVGCFLWFMYTVVWTDYRFYSPKLCCFFPEALAIKSKTNAYMGHLLYNVKRTCFNY